MPKCFKCCEIKDATEFYRHPQMASGHLGKCKSCTKKDVRDRYAMCREQRAAYERIRFADPARRRKVREYMKQYRIRNPLKTNARQTVSNAVRDGKLIRLPCVHCGNERSQAHHTDYSKPLEVTWMCFRCHREKGHGQVVVATSC